MSTKYYTNSRPSINDSVPALKISPETLHFGVISNGFVYSLKFTVQNNLLVPLKIRPITVPYKTEYEEEEKLNFELPLTDNMNTIRLTEMPEKIAPGMVLNMALELTAEAVCTVQFLLNISQDYSNEVFSKVITANIVSVDAFKHVKKVLQLQKRPIYRPNVNPIGPTPGFDQFSASAPTLATSNTTLMLMDVDEMEDMADYPFAPNLYWDPFDKCMRLDPQLNKVQVGGELGSLEASISKTTAKRDKRNKQLEDQGFFTRRMIDRLRSEEFDNFRRYGTNSLLTLSGSGSGDLLYSRHAAANEEYEEAEEVDGEDEEGEELGMNSPTRHGQSQPFGGHMASDASVLSGDTSSLISKNSQRSMTSVLAMQRTRRQRLEYQRKKSVFAASEFAKLSSTDKTVQPHKTLAMILKRQKSVVPNADLIK